MSMCELSHTKQLLKQAHVETPVLPGHCLLPLSSPHRPAAHSPEFMEEGTIQCADISWATVLFDAVGKTKR